MSALGGKRLTLLERQNAFRKFQPELIIRASHAQKNGINWRPEKPAKIGCCVLGHDGYGHFDTNSVGWNNTPRRLSDEEKRHFKPCAEKYAVLQCLRRRLIPIGMLTYSTHNQPDDVTGLERKVLCCCSNCTLWMQEINTPGDFLIESVRPELEGDNPLSEDGFVVERYDLNRLVRMHEEALNRPTM
ncbi:MAG: hypothetical protein NT019_00810 [Candidatus Adlerbacteria bacterium]|nr:hypothetical protein [Candidatus Adlerbacteria bacterium]